jgi:hypothetical protein
VDGETSIYYHACPKILVNLYLFRNSNQPKLIPSRFASGGKLRKETVPDHGFSEVPNHRLEEVLLVIGHVAPVAMLLPLHANPAVLVQVLHTLLIRLG